MFSKSCEYGLKAVIYIATQSLNGQKVIKVGEIAENTNLPMAFTAKLLGGLSKNGLLQSQTGPNGGFYFDQEKMKQVKLSEIVASIDGDAVYNGCGLGLDYCDAENPCPLHDNFAHIRAELRDMLKNTSVYDLAMKVKSGKSVLVRNCDSKV